MSISKSEAAEIAAELEPLIKATFAKYGLDAPKISWKYGAWFEYKVAGSLLTLGDNGVNLDSPEARYYTSFGHTAYSGGAFTKLVAPLGTKFTVRGTMYIFSGIAAKRKKYPIYAYNVDDATYTFFADSVVNTINEAAKESVA